MEAMTLVELAGMTRPAKFPASAAGRLFNVLEIFGTFVAAHRTAAKEIHIGTYVLSQCSFSTIIASAIQYYRLYL